AAQKIDQIGPRTQEVRGENYAAVQYVSTNGSDEAGDGSQQKPWSTAAAAIARVTGAAADHRHAIFFAAGVYRVSSLQLKMHVDVFGGFDAGTWKRDIADQATTFDADHKDRAI